MAKRASLTRPVSDLNVYGKVLDDGRWMDGVGTDEMQAALYWMRKKRRRQRQTRAVYLNDNQPIALLGGGKFIVGFNLSGDFALPLIGGGTLDVTLTQAWELAAAMQGGGTLEAAIAQEWLLQANMAGGGVLDFTLEFHLEVPLDFFGGGGLGVVLTRSWELAVAMHGGGTMTAQVFGQVDLPGTFAGGGTLGASLFKSWNIPARFAGGGTMGAAFALKDIMIDGSAGSYSGAAASSISTTLSTHQDNDLIVVFVSSFGAAQDSTVSGGGLTWTLRSRVHYVGGLAITGEEWYAFAPTQLTNVVITATFAGSAGSRSILALAAHNASFATPYDPNGSIPNYAVDEGPAVQTPSVSVSTDDATDMLIGYMWMGSQVGVVGSGYTEVTHTAGAIAEYKRVQTKQVATPVDFGPEGGFFMMADALVEDQIIVRIQGGGTMSTVLTKAWTLAVSYAGGGTMSALVDHHLELPTPYVGGGTLAAAITRAWSLTVAPVGGGTLSTVLTKAWTLALTYQGGGTMAALLSQNIVLAPAYVGGGVLGATITRAWSITTAYVGGGTEAVTLTHQFPMQVDGTATGTGGGGATTLLSSTLTTTKSGNLIVVFAGHSGSTGAPTVTSVTATGLTFTKRGDFANTGNTSFASYLSMWTARATGTFSGTITVNYSGTAGNRDMVAFGIVSANASPFDGHAGLPVKNFNAAGTTAPTATISTSNANDMILFCSSDANAPGLPTGFTLVAKTGSNNMQVSQKVVAAAQTNLAITNSSGTSTAWMVMADGIQSI